MRIKHIAIACIASAVALCALSCNKDNVSDNQQGNNATDTNSGATHPSDTTGNGQTLAYSDNDLFSFAFEAMGSGYSTVGNTLLAYGYTAYDDEFIKIANGSTYEFDIDHSGQSVEKVKYDVENGMTMAQSIQRHIADVRRAQQLIANPTQIYGGPSANEHEYTTFDDYVDAVSAATSDWSLHVTYANRKVKLEVDDKGFGGKIDATSGASSKIAR